MPGLAGMCSLSPAPHSTDGDNCSTPGLFSPSQFQEPDEQEGFVVRIGAFSLVVISWVELSLAFRNRKAARLGVSGLFSKQNTSLATALCVLD